MRDQKEDYPVVDQKPPLFKSWRSMYVFVMAVFAILVGLFYLFTKIYS